MVYLEIVGNLLITSRSILVSKLSGVLWTLYSKEKSHVRSITCLAISPDGTLAVGESRYLPQIRLFTLGPSLFGLDPNLFNDIIDRFFDDGLTVSPDTQCLFSKGLLHDGFITLWSLEVEYKLV